MTPAPFKSYQPVALEFLTPVAVGSGQTLDPTRYIMQRVKNREQLHLLDIERYLIDNATDQGLVSLLDRGDYRELRREIQRRMRPTPEKNDLDEYTLSIFEMLPGSEAYASYAQDLNQPDTNKRFELDSALRNPVTHRLILPGSSLKGAIRTAVLDFLDREHQLTLKNRMPSFERRGQKVWDDKQFNQALEDLLGRIRDNDFKALQLNDFEVPAEGCLVVKPIEEGLKPTPANRPRTPKNACECVRGLAVDPTRPVRSYSRAGLGNPDSLNTLTVHKRNQGIQQDEVLDWKKLCRLVTGFFQVRFEEELKKFYGVQHLNQVASALKPVQERIAGMKEDEMLLRIGHYSHIESMTLSDVDPEMQRTFRGGKSFLPGNTRTLAEGRFPFGWCILGSSSEQELSDWHQVLASNVQTPSRQSAPTEETGPEADPRQQMLEELKGLSDWGQVLQFLDTRLGELEDKAILEELSEAVLARVLELPVSKKKLKQNPNLKEERLQQVRDRFQKAGEDG